MKLMNTLITQIKLREVDRGTLVSINEKTARYRWCAVDERTGIAIDLLNKNQYAYIDSLNGIYITSHLDLYEDETYALFGTQSLINVPNNIKRKFNRIDAKQKIKRK